jgi:hypothetical protein
MICVLQTFRVTVMFLAQQLERTPIHTEAFEVGALLFALSSEDGYTIFCRRDDPETLDDRPHFTIPDEEFEQSTILA